MIQRQGIFRAIKALLSVGLLVVVVATGAAFQAVPNLVAYYKYEETTGTTAADSSGNGLTANWSGNTALISFSVAGDCAPNTPNNTRSIIFSKPATVLTTGGWLTTANAAATRFTAPFTAMVWIKPSAFAAGDNHNDNGSILFDWDYNLGHIRGWGVHRSVAGNILFYTGDNTTTDTTQSPGTAAVGAWTHVTVVYDGANKLIYLNGVQNSSVASALVPTATTNNFQVGKDDYDRNFYGNVDEVRLFNAALTAPQIMSLYQGVAPPTNLTATAGNNQVTLNWTVAPNATTYNILRGTTTGGPYTQIANVPGTATSYVDTTAMFPTTYFYVLQTVFGGVNSLYSNEVSCTPLNPQVSALPNAGLQTNESGASTTFTIQYNLPAPAGGSVLTVLSSNTAEGVVSTTTVATTPVAGGFTYTVPQGLSPTIIVTVTGIDDPVVDGPINYQINVTATNMGVTIPAVQCTNNDNDTPGITFSRLSGLLTSESGGQDNFVVVLNTKPTGAVNMPLASTQPTEGIPSPASLQFTTTDGQAYNALTGIGGWNVGHTVTLTGVDDTILDQAQPYSITCGPVTSGDLNYNFPATSVSAHNLDNEIPPELEKVWGSGCGLLGFELALPLALAALLRRRRRR